MWQAKEKKKKKVKEQSQDKEGGKTTKKAKKKNKQQKGEDETPDVVQTAQDEDATAARWKAANQQRKDQAKKDAAKRKEDAGEWDEWDKISQAERDFIEAVEDEDLQGVEAAIQNGANINRHYMISGDITSALMHCSLMGFAELADVLLKHDADLHLDLQGTGFTPIHGASFQGHPEIVKSLLAAGADANERHTDGFIAMHRACWGNTPKHTETVITFLEHGVDVLTTAVDPNYPESDTFKETGGLMTPLNMSGANPMTLGLLTEWEKHGRAPMGPMQNWGQDAYVSNDKDEL